MKKGRWIVRRALWILLVYVCCHGSFADTPVSLSLNAPGQNQADVQQPPDNGEIASEGLTKIVDDEVGVPPPKGPEDHTASTEDSASRALDRDPVSVVVEEAEGDSTSSQANKVVDEPPDEHQSPPGSPSSEPPVEHQQGPAQHVEPSSVENQEKVVAQNVEYLERGGPMAKEDVGEEDGMLLQVSESRSNLGYAQPCHPVCPDTTASHVLLKSLEPTKEEFGTDVQGSPPKAASSSSDYDTVASSAIPEVTVEAAPETPAAKETSATDKLEVVMGDSSESQMPSGDVPEHPEVAAALPREAQAILQDSTLSSAGLGHPATIGLESDSSELLSGNSALPTEDMPSFSEWAKKQMEEQGIHGQAAGQPGKPSGKRLRHKNYASVDCGAKVVGANAEAQSTGAVLSHYRDDYMLNPCTAKIWLVIELCDSIQVHRVDLANFELYSSSPRKFVVHSSDRFPTREWTHLGVFEAKDERNEQSFTLTHNSFSKYIKIELESHYGSEHFCPLSLVRVFGTSELDALETEDHREDAVAGQVHQSGGLLPEDEADDEELLGDPSATPPQESQNLFGSAKDVVIHMMKKAAEVLRSDKSGPDPANKDQSEQGVGVSEMATDPFPKVGCMSLPRLPMSHCGASSIVNDTCKKRQSTIFLTCSYSEVLRFLSDRWTAVETAGHFSKRCSSACEPFLRDCDVEGSVLQPAVDVGSSVPQPSTCVRQPSTCHFFGAVLGPVRFGALCLLDKSLLDEQQQVPLTRSSSCIFGNATLEPSSGNLHSVDVAPMVTPTATDSPKSPSSQVYTLDTVQADSCGSGEGRVLCSTTGSSKDTTSGSTGSVTPVPVIRTDRISTDVAGEHLPGSVEASSSSPPSVLSQISPTKTMQQGERITPRQTVVQKPVGTAPSVSGIESSDKVSSDAKGSESRSSLSMPCSDSQAPKDEASVAEPGDGGGNDDGAVASGDGAQHVSSGSVTVEESSSRCSDATGQHPAAVVRFNESGEVQSDGTGQRVPESDGKDGGASILSASLLPTTVASKSPAAGAATAATSSPSPILGTVADSLSVAHSAAGSADSQGTSSPPSAPQGGNGPAASPSSSTVTLSPSVSRLDFTMTELRNGNDQGRQQQVGGGQQGSSLVPGQKESVFVRLSNRIKALELNMSLSGQYLEELSRRYRKQMEEMQRAFNKTISALNDTARKAYDRDLKQQELIMTLQGQLDSLTKVVLHLQEEQSGLHSTILTRHILMMMVEALVMTVVVVACNNRSASSRSSRRVATVDRALHTATANLQQRRGSRDAGPSLALMATASTETAVTKMQQKQQQQIQRRNSDSGIKPQVSKSTRDGAVTKTLERRSSSTDSVGAVDTDNLTNALKVPNRESPLDRTTCRDADHLPKKKKRQRNNGGTKSGQGGGQGKSSLVRSLSNGVLSTSSSSSSQSHGQPPSSCTAAGLYGRKTSLVEAGCRKSSVFHSATSADVCGRRSVSGVLQELVNGCGGSGRPPASAPPLSSAAIQVPANRVSSLPLLNSCSNPNESITYSLSNLMYGGYVPELPDKVPGHGSGGSLCCGSHIAVPSQQLQRVHSRQGSSDFFGKKEVEKPCR